jgi:hypothetical protein
MFAIIYLLGTFIADLLKSRCRLEVENLFYAAGCWPAGLRAVRGRHAATRSHHITRRRSGVANLAMDAPDGKVDPLALKRRTPCQDC